jgi:hypothetical protein
MTLFFNSIKASILREALIVLQPVWEETNFHKSSSLDDANKELSKTIHSCTHFTG